MLVDLPSEILIQIAEELGDFDEKAEGIKPDLLNFLVTNIYIYTTCREVLYRSLVYANGQSCNNGRLLGMLTAVYHGGFSHHIRHIRLRDQYALKRSDIWDRLALVTNRGITGPVSAGKYLWREATNLQTLDLDYSGYARYLNECSNTIRELTVRAPKSEQLSIEFLPFVLKWPRLRVLSLRSRAIAEIPELYKFVYAITPKTSSVVHLTIEASEIPECVMIALLEAPRALESFTYGTISYARNFKIAADKRPEESLPRTSQIAVALSNHHATLESLTIERTGKYWNQQMDDFGALQQFQVLKNLQIDATMLLGWDHCQHWRYVRPALPEIHPDLPAEFATHLPTSLENLAVVLDRMLFTEKLKRYLVSLVQGILLRVQRKCLSNLRLVRIKYSCIRYCRYCETDDQWKDHGPPVFVTSYPTIKRLMAFANDLNVKLIFGND